MHSRNETKPLWTATFGIEERAPLAQDMTADVCVIGAGISGLSVAYRLAAGGVKAVVLDAGRIGGGETERTTAHLALALDEGYAGLLRVHGEKNIRLAAESHALAIDEIERAAAAEGIDCGFERLDGYLFSTPGEPPDEIVDEFAACLKAGIAGIVPVRGAPLQGFATGAAIRYPRQGQFHPLRYLSGLAAAFERLGGRIFCGTKVVDVKDGSSVRVETERGHAVSAGAAVVATDTPFNDRFSIHTKQASYRTYVIAAPISKGEVPRALYWDMEDPYHYVRVQAASTSADDELLIVGGEDHKTGQQTGTPEERFARLDVWARRRFAGLGAVSHRWSGQVIGTSDGMAFIGRNPGGRNVFIVSGDCGHGMTHGTIAGLMLPQLIAGRPHPWEKLYDPSRVRAGSVARWTRENLNAAAQYARHLKLGEVSSVDEIAPGTGAVIRRGLSKVAVYRAPDGTFIEKSAVCPHLGAVVCWNAGEKTWDCPAHGSRFDPEGNVLNGPSAAGLSDVPSRPAGPLFGRKRR